MYVYANHREWLNSEQGIRAVGEVLRNVERVLRPAGAALMSAVWPTAANTDQMMAAVDRVVEMGVIVELKLEMHPSGQRRVFVLAERM